MEKPKHHIFVCVSSRLTGQNQGYCHQNGGPEIIAAFNEEIADRELSGEIMLSSTGCLGLCAMGPVVMIYPQQVWYQKVTAEDVEEIMDALEEGEVVERLAL